MTRPRKFSRAVLPTLTWLETNLYCRLRLDRIGTIELLVVTALKIATKGYCAVQNRADYGMRA